MKTKTLTVIQLAIERYDQHKHNLSVEKVQELRDDISIALSNLAEHYADCKMNAEAAEYMRKKRLAEIKREIVGTVDEQTGKKFTVSSAEDVALIGAKSEYDKEHLAIRDYEHIRQIVNTANNVVNSMASSINIKLRNGE